MGFGTPFARKPRTPEPVRPMAGALVRIIVLAVLAAAAAAYGMYLYYTHAFRPKPRPLPSADPSGEVWIDLSPSSPASGGQPR